MPDSFEILDLIEFCWGRIAKAFSAEDSYHSFFKHYHFTSFNREQGQNEFRQQINLIFARNQIAFELTVDGEVHRLGPVVLRDSLSSAVFHTSDSHLDDLLEEARKAFFDPDPNVRKDALDKLWDAWERLKTLEDSDKRKSIGLLLDKAAMAESNFRALLEEEARELTSIGNSFMIRHTEVGKTELVCSEHVDYLFHRLFALIRLILKATNRGG